MDQNQENNSQFPQKPVNSPSSLSSQAMSSQDQDTSNKNVSKTGKSHQNIFKTLIRHFFDTNEDNTSIVGANSNDAKQIRLQPSSFLSKSHLKVNDNNEASTASLKKNSTNKSSEKINNNSKIKSNIIYQNDNNKTFDLQQIKINNDNQVKLKIDVNNIENMNFKNSSVNNTHTNNDKQSSLMVNAKISINKIKLKSENSNVNLREKKLDSILNRTLSDSILNKKSSSMNLGIPNIKKTSGLSRKNSSNRRSIFNQASIFNRSSSNILTRKNFLSPSASPSPINFGFNNFNLNSSNSRSLKKHLSHNRMQHHRSTCCVLNTSFISSSSDKISFNKKKSVNNQGLNECYDSNIQDIISSPISTPLSESPLTVNANQLTFTSLSTPPPPLLLDNNTCATGDNYVHHNKRLPSSPRLHLTPATSSFNQKTGLPYNNQSLLITSFKNNDARRWSFASMNSSSGYGTNTPSNNIGENSNSNQSLQYSSNEKLILTPKQKQQLLAPQSAITTPENNENKNKNNLLAENCSIEIQNPKYNQTNLCGNSNCQNCSNLIFNNDIFTDKVSDASMLPFLARQNRISSSNESIQLDDSSEMGGYSSPSSYYRQRARSLSCSPSKSHNDSEVIILHNEKFKEKFPKACTQMEDNLQKFIDFNKDLNHLEQKQLNPAARFIHNQIIELAKLCLEKSKANQLTCAYFDEVTTSLDQLLLEAIEKCSNDDQSVEYLNNFVKKFLLIVSRVARLLECLEFDPLEFCHLLDAAEEQARKTIKTNIPKYIISKLGLIRDPFDEIGSSNDESTEVKKEKDDQPKLKSIIQKNEAPTENDFEQIKLISNGAYGAVYLVKHKQLKNERFAMKKIKKHNLVLRNQLQQVFTERDIMIFTDYPFVVDLICTFETKKYLCMVMEYVEGGDVATLIKKTGPLSIELARTYFAETTLAVNYLHNYGIIHRDLKPDNLLITAEGHIKLTDFGLSKIGLMNLTTNFYEGNNLKNFMKDHYCKEFNDKQICGTPQYLAPEVILRQRYGKTVDWWSMGIILYEFLTSLPPFNGNTPEDLFENVINGEILWPEDDDELIHIPLEAKDLINGLLTHDPIKRLGAGGAIEIKEHEFFTNLNWEDLLGHKGDFIPQLDSPDDTSYFDTRQERYNHEESDSPPLQKQSIDYPNNTDSITDHPIKMKKININVSSSFKLISSDLSKKNFKKNKNNNIHNNYNNIKQKTHNQNQHLDELLDKKLKLKNDNNNEQVLIDDTDNELFASFSSCSSKFRLSSVSNTNSPVFMNENRSRSHLHISKSNSFVSIGGNTNPSFNVTKSSQRNCNFNLSDVNKQQHEKHSSLPLETSINDTNSTTLLPISSSFLLDNKQEFKNDENTENLNVNNRININKNCDFVLSSKKTEDLD